MIVFGLGLWFGSLVWVFGFGSLVELNFGSQFSVLRAAYSDS